MLDATYQDKLQIALMLAIVDASHDDKLGAPLLKSGEIVAAMTVVMAGILTTSPEIASPTKIRRMADHVAKRLAKSIIAIKEAGGFQVPHIVVDASVVHGTGFSPARH